MHEYNLLLEFMGLEKFGTPQVQQPPIQPQPTSVQSQPITSILPKQQKINMKKKMEMIRVRMNHAKRLATFRARLAKADPTTREKIQSTINRYMVWYNNKIRQLA